MSTVDGTCPKHMVYGPCGGVRADLSCEMGPQPCPFVHRPGPVPWDERWDARPDPGPHGGGSGQAPVSALLAAAARGPVVVTDLSLPAFDADALAHLTGILASSCDALLVGEHQGSPDFPPTLMAALVRAAGGVPWVTLTCRDRNRVILEQEVAGLTLAGADGVLCVTGDGRGHGTRPGITSTFDLDGTRLAALAASYGLATAVAESPGAPPSSVRPARLAQKQRAGAHLAILNHVSGPDEIRVFVEAAAHAGVDIPIVAAVAVFTDEPSAAVLANFPGLHLDPGRVARVLSAPDPEAAGVKSAVHEAEQLLAIDGVAGINLSGLGSGRGLEHAAEVKARVGELVRS